MPRNIKLFMFSHGIQPENRDNACSLTRLRQTGLGESRGVELHTMWIRRMNTDFRLLPLVALAEWKMQACVRVWLLPVAFAVRS